MLWRHASRFDGIGQMAGGMVLLALPLIAVVLATGLAFPAQTDEVKFHWEVAQQFGMALPAVPWADYHAATTPLPYVAWGAWGRLFGFSLPALRALTVIVSYLGIMAFYDLAQRRGHPSPLVESLLLLFSPYIFLNSFTLYTVNMGLAFQVLALRFYLDEKQTGWKKWALGGAATTAAIYCRQHYLFMTIGLGIAWLIERMRGRHISLADLRDLGLIIAPAALVAPLFIIWGGFTPPDFQALHPLEARLDHVNFLVVLIGLYCAPLGIVAWPALWRWGKKMLWLSLGLPIYALCPPRFEAWGPAGEQGLILRGLQLIGQWSSIPVAMGGQLTLWLNGLAVGAVAWRGDGFRNRESLTLWSMTAAFAGVLLISSFVGERFYALIMPVLLLLLYPRLASQPAVRGMWLVMMAGLGLAYSMFKLRGG